MEVSRVRARLLIGIACVCLSLLSGCLGSDPVQKQWASREPLPSCGSLHLRQFSDLKISGKKELGCLRHALDSSRGAELAVRYPTTEGDPITDYLRVVPGGATEVYTDSTEDANSNQDWSFANCDQPKSVLDVNC